MCRVVVSSARQIMPRTKMRRWRGCHGSRKTEQDAKAASGLQLLQYRPAIQKRLLV